MKLNMKPFARWAAAMALGVAAMGQATAATYNIGAVGTTPYLHFSSISGASVSFADIYHFQILPGFQAGALSLQNHPLTFHTPFSLSVLDIGGLSMDIYDGSNTLLAGSVASFSGDLAPGGYYASVSGLTAGVAGGAYSFAIAAVPEADSWALFAAGLGVVFLAYSRRRG